MKNTLIFIAYFILSNVTNAAGFAEGVPVVIQKSDFGNLNLVYIGLDKSIDVSNECDGQAGLVLLDSNPSTELGQSLALTALASGKKFRCYITDNCSRVTGAVTTFPVCDYYPAIVN